MRLKAREAFIEGRSITDASQYEERINLAREVADVLNKNVVQGTRTSEEDVWSELSVISTIMLADMGPKKFISGLPQSSEIMRQSKIPHPQSLGNGNGLCCDISDLCAIGDFKH
jgi:hypothetical protein